ncbi:E3 ubiquitin-protein ligase RNF13, partial [Biomphalaria pfeifferi]
VKNAQFANYSAAIVYNNNSEELVHMSGDGKGIKIPSTFVGSSTGLLLKDQYNYTRQNIIIQIVEDNGPIIDFLVWPFVLVIGICFLIGLVYLIIKLCKDHLNKKVNRLSSKHLKKIPVRKFKKGNLVVPSLSEPEDDDGAVGGLTITDMYIQARDAAQKRRERKRKRTERERLIDREDAGDGSEPMAPGLVKFGESASGSVVNETREERRDRRRKRKEQKKASKRSNTQSDAPIAGESSSAGNVRRSEENGSRLGDDTNEVVVQVAERSELKPPSDRQEPRALPLRGRHHELNEVV